MLESSCCPVLSKVLVGCICISLHPRFRVKRPIRYFCKSDPSVLCSFARYAVEFAAVRLGLLLDRGTILSVFLDAVLFE